MSLPSHRRTSSDKRRRASHFALKKQTLTKDEKTGQEHRPHRAAPGQTEYRGHEIHIKGKEKKLEKLLNKSKKSEAEANKETPAKK